jgi:Raf kinase inhibitor-like YbhB/YbcL family protein
MRPPVAVRAALIVLAVAASACDTGDGKTLDPPTAPPPVTTAPEGDPSVVETVPPTLPAVFELITPWRFGAPIDTRHTCDGDDVSPAMSWTAPPDGTVELALVVVDDDADGFVHWLVTGIDPGVFSIVEGAAPNGSTERVNSFGDVGWGGPCPPAGETHSYRFALHALNQPVDAADDMSAADVVALVEERSIEVADTSGTYTRGG